MRLRLSLVAAQVIGALLPVETAPCQAANADLKTHVASVIREARKRLGNHTVSLGAVIHGGSRRNSWAFSDWTWNVQPNARWIMKYSLVHGNEQGPDSSDIGAATVFITRASMYRFWVPQRCYSRVDLDGELPTGAYGGVYGIMWGFAPRLSGYKPETIEGHPVDILALLADPKVSCVKDSSGGYLVSTSDGRHRTWLRGDQKCLHASRREWRSPSGQVSLRAVAGPPLLLDRRRPHDALRWTVTSYSNPDDGGGESIERVCSVQSAPAIPSVAGKGLSDMLGQPGMARFDSMTNSVLQVAEGGTELIDDMASWLRATRPPASPAWNNGAVFAASFALGFIGLLFLTKRGAS